MSFPHRKPSLFNTTAVVTIIDLFIATMILFSTAASMVGITKAMWHGCVYIWQHWWIIFQLPIYWVAIVFWLLLVIVACVFVAISCTVYNQVWNSFKAWIIPEEDEVY